MRSVVRTPRSAVISTSSISSSSPLSISLRPPNSFASRATKPLRVLARPLADRGDALLVLRSSRPRCARLRRLRSSAAAAPRLRRSIARRLVRRGGFARHLGRARASAALRARFGARLRGLRSAGSSGGRRLADRRDSTTHDHDRDDGCDDGERRCPWLKRAPGPKPSHYRNSRRLAVNDDVGLLHAPNHCPQTGMVRSGKRANRFTSRLCVDRGDVVGARRRLARKPRALPAQRELNERLRRTPTLLRVLERLARRPALPQLRDRQHAQRRRLVRLHGRASAGSAAAPARPTTRRDAGSRAVAVQRRVTGGGDRQRKVGRPRVRTSETGPRGRSRASSARAGAPDERDRGAEQAAVRSRRRAPCRRSRGARRVRARARRGGCRRRPRSAIALAARVGRRRAVAAARPATRIAHSGSSNHSGLGELGRERELDHRLSGSSRPRRRRFRSVPARSARAAPFGASRERQCPRENDRRDRSAPWRCAPRRRTVRPLRRRAPPGCRAACPSSTSAPRSFSTRRVELQQRCAPAQHRDLALAPRRAARRLRVCAISLPLPGAPSAALAHRGPRRRHPRRCCRARACGRVRPATSMRESAAALRRARAQRDAHATRASRSSRSARGSMNSRRTSARVRSTTRSASLAAW